MSRIDFIDPIFEPSAPMSLNSATLYVARNRGIASFAILYNKGGEAIIFPRIKSWNQIDVDRLCHQYDYNEAVWLNVDGTTGESILTGTGKRLVTQRRQLVLVA